MLYRFVDEQKAEGFPTERICEIAGVSTSAYCDWKEHRDGIVGASVVRERLLVNEIRQIHKTSKGTYGSPRVTVELRNRGRMVNHKRVERLMRVYDIVGYTPKKRTVTTIPYAAHRFPDLVKRDFAPDGLDQTWCGDITYVRTWEGFLYLAVVEDLASRRILGVSMASRMRASLVGDALTEAVGTRGGHVTGVVFHSDRGSQAIHLRRIRRPLCRLLRHPVGGPHRGVLGQRTGRIVLRRPEERTRPPNHVPEPC